MNDLVRTVTQDTVLAVEDAIKGGALPPVELTYDHYFADGVYARVMKAPAGALVIGKAHRTEHLSILLKGSCTITNDDGSVVYAEAPLIVVTPPGKKKMALVHTDMEFVNVHPTMTTDLDEIEKRVIIPEQEYRDMLLASNRAVEELTMKMTTTEVNHVVG